jgi:hypothetical protein
MMSKDELRRFTESLERCQRNPNFMGLECLLRAMRDCDVQVIPEVERAWRATLSPGIAVTEAAYERSCNPTRISFTSSSTGIGS